MGKQLTHAPVYFAIAKVHFNPIAALDNFIPQIQDRFRLKDFPDQETQNITTLHFNAGAPQQSMNPVPQVLHIAKNMKQTSGFILDKDSLSYQTTNYLTRDEFFNDFVLGLKIIHEIVGLSYVARLGLRYLDAIYPEDNTNIIDYVENSVLGMYGKLGGDFKQNFSETVHENNGIQLISRAITRTGEVGFPPDLHPQTLKISDQFLNKTGLNVMLDIDASKTKRMEFDIDKTLDELKALKTEASASFHKTVTENALKRWS